MGLHIRNRRTQTKIELVLCNGFKVLCFIRVTVSRAARFTETVGVVALGVHRCQIDIVCVVFQAAAVSRCLITVTNDCRIVTAILFAGTVRRHHRCCCAETFAQIICQGHPVAVAILRQDIAAIVRFSRTAIFALILHRHIQSIDHAEEIFVAVCQYTVRTLEHEVVRAVGIATELRQNIRPCCHVIHHAVVTTVIQ
ncbi:hypothetical protein SRABI106_03722 [Rahnella aquatilis]|nr:hypothetical protein SRABI106_03722 [Rahnella aquatilis]